MEVSRYIMDVVGSRFLKAGLRLALAWSLFLLHTPMSQAAHVQKQLSGAGKSLKLGSTPNALNASGNLALKSPASLGAALPNALPQVQANPVTSVSGKASAGSNTQVSVGKGDAGSGEAHQENLEAQSVPGGNTPLDNPNAFNPAVISVPQQQVQGRESKDREPQVAGAKEVAATIGAARVFTVPGQAGPAFDQSRFLSAVAAAADDRPDGADDSNGLEPAGAEFASRQDADVPETQELPEVRAVESSWLSDRWQYWRAVWKTVFGNGIRDSVWHWRRQLRISDRPADAPVRDIKEFAISLRLVGTTGLFSPLGIRPASEKQTYQDALDFYDRFFEAPPEARDAFERYLKRVAESGVVTRPSVLRKYLLPVIERAARVSRHELASLFDERPIEGVYGENLSAAHHREVLAEFDKTVAEVIAEMNAYLPEGRRVVGAVLLGSFVHGGARQESDLDVQVIVEDGRKLTRDVFMHNFVNRWTRKIDGVTHPVDFKSYVLTPSRALFYRIQDQKYHFSSPYPQARVALQDMRETVIPPAPDRGFFGNLSMAAYKVAVRIAVRLPFQWLETKPGIPPEESTVREERLNRRAIAGALAVRTVSIAWFILRLSAYPLLAKTVMSDFGYGNILALSALLAILIGPLNGKISDKLSDRTSFLIIQGANGILLILMGLFAMNGWLNFTTLLLLAFADTWVTISHRATEMAFFKRNSGQSHRTMLSFVGVHYNAMQAGLGLIAGAGALVYFFGLAETYLYAGLSQFLIVLPIVYFTLPTEKPPQLDPVEQLKRLPPNRRSGGVLSGAILLTAAIVIYALTSSPLPIALAIFYFVARSADVKAMKSGAMNKPTETELELESRIDRLTPQEGRLLKRYKARSLMNTLFVSMGGGFLGLPLQKFVFPMAAIALVGEEMKPVLITKLIGALLLGKLFTISSQIQHKLLQRSVQALIMFMAGAWLYQIMGGTFAILFTAAALQPLTWGLAGAGLAAIMMYASGRINDLWWVRLSPLGAMSIWLPTLVWLMPGLIPGLTPAVAFMISAFLFGFFNGARENAQNIYYQLHAHNSFRGTMTGIQSSYYNTSQSLGFALFAFVIFMMGGFPHALLPIAVLFTIFGLSYILLPHYLPEFADRSREES